MRFLFMTAVSVILLISLGCPSPHKSSYQNNDSTPSATQAPTPSRSLPSPTATAKVEYAPPQVQFINVTLTGAEPQYDLTATIRNDGPTDAHLTGGCNWKCPVFPETAGGSVFMSGELLGKGKERSFHTMKGGKCALPLQTTCRVEVRSWVNGEKGSETKTIEWTGQLTSP